MKAHPNNEKPGGYRASQRTNFIDHEIIPKANSCGNSTQGQIRPRPKWLRELYAALPLAPDVAKTPIIASNWNIPTRQELLQKIASAEAALEMRHV